MAAPAFRGDPDEEPLVSRHGHRGEPTEKQCDWCERWVASPVDFARIWFFCDDDCRQSWVANAPQNQPQADEECPY